MAEKSVKRTPTEIDPMFFIPEGVDELVYENEQHESGDEEFFEVWADDSALVDEADSNYFEGPETPDILGVVTQTVRTTGSGTQVVDLVLLVEDIPGLSKYDFRVTKN